ncbi:hypothetical protein D3C72_655990 [compost metagenome]
MNIPEANIRNMLRSISEGNHVLNETAFFYTESETDCPDCRYDPIRKESTNPNCQTCGGTGSITTQVIDEVQVSIETEEDFKYEFTKAGKLVKGQILLTIDIKEINEILNVSQSFNLDQYDELKSFMEQYKQVKWKGAAYVIESFEPGWLQGNLYEIAAVLNLKD